MSLDKQVLTDADFDKMDGLIPAIIQDRFTGQVLMLGYMNKKALKQTFKTGLVTFYSRSKKRLWTKGEESGNVLKVHSISLDCDQDTFLIQVEPAGPVCHKGTDTCWGEKNSERFSYLYELEAIVLDRKKHPKKNSYTNRLLERGPAKIAQKIGEEAVEIVIEAVKNDKVLMRDEYSDLMYHLTVMLIEKGMSWTEIFKTLKARRK